MSLWGFHAFYQEKSGPGEFVKNVIKVINHNLHFEMSVRSKMIALFLSV